MDRLLSVLCLWYRFACSHLLRLQLKNHLSLDSSLSLSLSASSSPSDCLLLLHLYTCIEYEMKLVITIQSMSEREKRLLSLSLSLLLLSVISCFQMNDLLNQVSNCVWYNFSLFLSIYLSISSLHHYITCNCNFLR